MGYKFIDDSNLEYLLSKIKGVTDTKVTTIQDGEINNIVIVDEDGQIKDSGMNLEGLGESVHVGTDDPPLDSMVLWIDPSGTPRTAAVIDDSLTADNTTWSSEKITAELQNAGGIFVVRDGKVCIKYKKAVTNNG